MLPSGSVTRTGSLLPPRRPNERGRRDEEVTTTPHATIRLSHTDWVPPATSPTQLHPSPHSLHPYLLPSSSTPVPSVPVSPVHLPGTPRGGAKQTRRPIFPPPLLSLRVLGSCPWTREASQAHGIDRRCSSAAPCDSHRGGEAHSQRGATPRHTSHALALLPRDAASCHNTPCSTPRGAAGLTRRADVPRETGGQSSGEGRRGKGPGACLRGGPTGDGRHLTNPTPTETSTE